MTRVCQLSLAMSTFQVIQALHRSSPPFSPYIALEFLPGFTLFLLATTFTLAFYFSTLPKHTIPVRETVVASIASILGGFGIVALFCTVGVYV